jgi:hypothetical protein
MRMQELVRGAAPRSRRSGSQPSVADRQTGAPSCRLRCRLGLPASVNRSCQQGDIGLTIDRMVNIIDRMVNTSSLNTSAAVVRAYVALTAATVLALLLLSFVAPDLATGHAWGHAIIVLVFAVLLPLRLRSARDGKRSGLRAVAIISGALVAVNIVEGVLPGFFPTWMRVEMFCVAVLMAANVLFVVRAGRDAGRRS